MDLKKYVGRRKFSVGSRGRRMKRRRRTKSEGGLGECGSCIVWREERESERRRNSCEGVKERKMREAGIDG